jgi:cAMP phosphodiesterase
LAVDAGSHLAAITNILSQNFPMVAAAPEASPSVESDKSSSAEEGEPDPHTTVLSTGPFAGLSFPHASARANAVHVVREHVSTYLITHPHLDHLSGFAINTAAFHNTSRPKRLAALPFTVNAIKNNIFNDVIWPNLTDEDNGVGFVTFQRLTEGGNLALGEGESRGFIEVCDGLAVKGFKISHGMCASRPPPSNTATVALQESIARRPSLPNAALHDGPAWQGNALNTPVKPGSHAADTPSAAAAARRSSLLYGSQPPTPTPSVLGHQASTGGAGAADHPGLSCVVDSSAFFIRTEQTHHTVLGREILVFGDVEPDSISVMPRNHIIWAEAAPKIVSGVLKAAFIECSYSDAQPDAVLFGHLAPRHVIQELVVLADMVSEERRRESLGMGASGLLPGESQRKRKRMSVGGNAVPVRELHAVEEENGTAARGTSEAVNAGSATSAATATMTAAGTSTPRSSKRRGGHLLVSTAGSGSKADTAQTLPTSMDLSAEPQTAPMAGPLQGFTVVIIHVKDTLMDGPLVGDLILADLREHEERLATQGRPLGCEFIISKSGESYWF